jgi:hypothetical protein
MSSDIVLQCDPHNKNEWKNFTNLKNLRHLYKDIQVGKSVLVKLRNVDPKFKFAPVLKVQGFEQGYEDTIYIFNKVWEKLCSQDRRNVKLEKPGHFARLQYYFLRLRYDEKFFFGTVLGFFSLLIGTLSIGIPLFPPWNYVLAVIFFVIGFISIRKGSR